MTTVYFVRHAEPNYNNHDDELRELTEKGLEDRKLVQNIYRINLLTLFYQAHIEDL